MALQENQLDSIVRGFIARIEEEIPVKEVILFGSYAEGRPNEYSDIDLAIVSRSFENKPAIENLKYLLRVAASYNPMIEALPFTESEYADPDSRGLLASILKRGKKYKG